MKTKKILIKVLICSIIASCFVQAGMLSNAAAGNSSGDVNNDGVVNISDVMLLASVFNSAIGDSKYSVSYDLNSDGAINISDVMIVAGNFNKTVATATSTPTQKVSPTSTPTTVKPTPSPSMETSPIIDDWNYITATKSISIKKIEKVSGTTKLTYYVADIKLSNGETILSAFAKNTFGKNILERTSTMAKNSNAVLAINGDYYSFRDDGIEIRNGKLYRDKPVRDCLIIYKDGRMETANEKSVSSSTLLANGAVQVISFGPILVKSGKALTTFENIPSDQTPTYLLQAHPRTGVGMIEPNHFIFIVVDGRAPGYSDLGMTMVEFAQTFEDLGCKVAYNLDGGGSSTMFFNGRLVNKPEGKTTERSVSDILYIAK